MNEAATRCVRWNERGVCVSGICRCPVCGGEKWCYALREPDAPEPPCGTCQRRTAEEQAQQQAAP